MTNAGHQEEFVMKAATTTTAETTTVDLVIRLQVAGSPADVATYRAALQNLAEVMAVQTEDGLWTLGHAEAETDGGPSELVAEIETARVCAVLIEGRDELTKGDVAAFAKEIL